MIARTGDDAQRLTVHVAGRVGLKQALTPEGFLLCSDVPVARVGEMLYAMGELPLESGRDGLIRVSRGSAELFDPVFLSSLNGKPVVDLQALGIDSENGDHPEEDVTPENWKDLAVGMMLNARPGQPPQNDCIVADLLITSKAAIESIRSGTRGVSLGYDAEYLQTAPGRALQRPVVANHLALTKTPRCGPVCSIGDSSMSKNSAALRSTTAVSRDSFWNRIRKAFNTKDAEALESAIGEAESAISEGASSSGNGEVAGGGAVHVHVYPSDKQADGATAETKDVDGEGEGEKPADPMAEIKAMLTSFGERLTKLEGGGATADAEGDPDADGEGAAEDRNEDGDDMPEETGDSDGSSGAGSTAGEGSMMGRTAAAVTGGSTGSGKTGDSAALAASFRDVIARAEIIAPGLKVVTFDAKAPRRKTIDAMCGIRRKALQKFATTDDGRAVLSTLDCGDLSKAGCETVAIAFNAAAMRKREMNNTRAYASRDSYRSTERKGPPTPAEMNEINRAFYKKK